MKVFVNRADLATSAQNARVIATYNDDVAIEPTAHGDGYVIMTLPPTAVQSIDGEMKLVKDWRNTNRQDLLSAEAAKRIDAAFPDYSQRNSAAEINNYILQYGADVDKWPTKAKTRKSEIDRCWNYVNAIRNKTGAMAQQGLPADPTANGNWPTQISPYQPL